VIPLRLVLAAALLLAGSLYAAENHELSKIGGNFVFLAVLAVGAVVWCSRRTAVRYGTKAALQNALKLSLGIPLTWLPLALLLALTGFPSGWIAFPLWLVLVIVVIAIGGNLVPTPIRRFWDSLFPAPLRDTHGSARFGTAQNAARHLAPAAPADTFVLGTLRDAPRGADRRFRQDGHMLTCAPTGAGKGIGAVIPNLLDYPRLGLCAGPQGRELRRHRPRPPREGSDGRAG
jgi:hypothetical protein